MDPKNKGKGKSKSSKRAMAGGSLREKTAVLLNDGKARTAEEIIKGIGGNAGDRSPMTFIKPIIVSLYKQGLKIDEPEKGKFQMKKGAYEKKSEEAPSSKPETKSASPAKKKSAAKKKAASAGAGSPPASQETGVSVE